MSEPAATAARSVLLAAPGDEPSPPRRLRARWRLLLLALLVGAWALPWSVAEGVPVARTEAGPQRTGAAGALALVAAFGLASTMLLARTRRGLAIGAALSDAATSALMTLLVATGHAWVPGPDLRSAWVPIFGPLALLAVIDAAVRARRVPVAREVAAIRCIAALTAGAALSAALFPLPAAVALWLGITPLPALLPRRPAGVRRAFEALSLLAAIVLLAAPELMKAVGAPALEIEPASIAPVAYRTIAAALVALSFAGVLRPEGE